MGAMKKHTALTQSSNQGVCHVALALTAALSFAALSNQQEQPLGIAACSFDIQLDQPWQQILPGTDFAAYDGRPFEVPGNLWRINDNSGQTLAATLNARAQAGRKLLFDYDHQTLLSKENGQKAPASARGNVFEWRTGQGLFAQLKFTPAARQHVKNEEYSFYSPVIIYDKTTGQVLDLHSVALTNDPAILGMAAAAALHATPTIHQPKPEQQPMNEALALLFSLLGITVDSTNDIDAAALHNQLTSPTAKTAIAALKAKLNDVGETSTTEIAALKAQVAELNKGVDLSTHVPIASYNAVITEMATLKANHSSVTVDSVIQKAQDDGKFIAAAEVAYLTELGNSNMAALKATLDGRPTIGAFKGKQTTEVKNPADQDKTGVAALTADQKLVAGQLGISHEDYAKQLAAE
jgi:phage I-like protein